MDTNSEPAVDTDLRYIRARAARHAVPGTGLWDFAHGGPTTDPAQLADDIHNLVAAAAGRPDHDPCADDDLGELYGLAIWFTSYRLHFHLGHNAAGYLPDEEPSCISDPAEAVEAFLAMVRTYAEEHDATAEQLLLETVTADEYLCFCGHDPTEHATTKPLGCETDDCECDGYQPDWGDDTPNTRALVEAALADNPPRPGYDHALSIAHGDGWRHEFFLHVLVIDADTAPCTPEAVIA